jgi:predicted SAM-dependent methyltransferase
MKVRVNIGCGATPTPGWHNFDNSLSLKLAHRPAVARTLGWLLSSQQVAYIDFCRRNRIEFADATRRIPLPDASAEIVYSSHMLEHLDRAEARSFMAEARRILCDGGILRIAVPDLGKFCREYIEYGDADRFMERMLVCEPKPKTLVERFREAFVGRRNHHWMYDGASLSKLLYSAGFREVTFPKPGETGISNPKPLDLFERADESVYAEAVK